MDQLLGELLLGIEHRLNLFSGRNWQAVDYQLNEEGASVVDVTQDVPPMTGDIKKAHVICRDLESSELAVFIANAPHDIGELLYNFRNEIRKTEEEKKKSDGLESQLKYEKDKYDRVIDLLKKEGEVTTKLRKKLDRLSPKLKLRLTSTTKIHLQRRKKK